MQREVETLRLQLINYIFSSEPYIMQGTHLKNVSRVPGGFVSQAELYFQDSESEDVVFRIPQFDFVLISRM